MEKVEKSYDKSKISVAKKIREVKPLENKVRILDRDLAMDKPMVEIKGILWKSINQSLNNVWPSIQTIYEQIDLVNATHGEIEKSRALLGQMLDQANRLIQFLNNRNREQLEQLGIPDKTCTILEIKRVLTKRNLMQNLERRCQDM